VAPMRTARATASKGGGPLAPRR